MTISYYKKTTSFFVLINYVLSTVHAHGILVDPPGRASMWRYGFNTPVDYNDNQLFCGGFNMQHFVNGGKCGICGDEYGKVQRNQPPGVFASGIISRTYTVGTNVTMQFQITASHRGYLEFRICPNNDVTKPATQACLDQYLLSDVVTGGTKFYFNYGTVGLYTAHLSLPPGLTCSQCVVQWRYRTGNSWGCVDDDIEKDCGIGFGRQEEFYACADVAIEALNGDGNNPSTTVVTNEPSSTSPPSLPTTPPSTISTTIVTNEPSSTSQPSSQTTPPYTTSTSQTSTSLTSTSTNQQTSLVSTQTTTLQTPSMCNAIGPYQGDPNMDKWCKINCEGGYCPASHCSPNCNQTSTQGPSTTTTIPSVTTQTTGSNVATTLITDSTFSTTQSSSTVETSISTTPSTTQPTISTTSVSYCPPLDQFSSNPEYAKWCIRSCIYNYCSPYLCKCTTMPLTASSTKLSTTRPTTEKPPKNKLVCIGAGVWRHDTSMASWCDTNCKLGHCPPSSCQCSKDGSLQDMTYGLGDKCYTVMTNVSSKYKQYMDLWCKHNCPSFGCWNIPNICKC